MAIAALVMGLAIGLGQKNKNDKTSSASSLQAYQRNCDVSVSGAPGGAKSGKGPTAPSEGKASKADPDRRELIVPGTEDAAVSLGSGKRRMMKEELLRGKLCCVLLSIYSFCYSLEGMDVEISWPNLHLRRSSFCWGFIVYRMALSFSVDGWGSYSRRSSPPLYEI